MISNTTAKFIKSLQLKKYRIKEQRFLVEGSKSVLEVLGSSYKVSLVVGTAEFLSENPNIKNQVDCVEIKADKLKALGTFKSNDSALAVVEMKADKAVKLAADQFTLALDGVNDPGNLGTIIRIADWYGIKDIIASNDTADFHNPKVISSSMGSFTRIDVNYCDLTSVLGNSKLPIYGALMSGENIHKVNFGKGGIVVMGNEANGISSTVEKLLNHKLTIPRFGNAESLNVAMATAVICDNIRRS